MSENESTINKILEELSKALECANELVGDPKNDSLTIIYFLRDLGWNIPLDTDLSRAEVSFISLVDALVGAPDMDFSDFQIMIMNIISSMGNFRDGLGLDISPIFNSDFDSKFPKQFLDYIIASYLESEHPTFHFALLLFGIINEDYYDNVDPHLSYRIPYIKKEFQWNMLTILLSDPKDFFSQVYGWGTSDLEVQRLFETIDYFLQSFDLPAVLFSTDSPLTTSVPEDSLRIPLIETDVDFGLEVYPLPTDSTADNAGLAISPYMNGSLKEKISLSDTLSLVINGSVALDKSIGFSLRPKEPKVDIIFDPSNPGTKGTFQFKLEHTPEEGKEYIQLLGSENGHRLEYKGLTFSLAFYLDKSNKFEFIGEIHVQDGRLVIAKGEGDSFLSKILPEDGIILEFDFGFGWSSERGVYFKGSSELEVSLPVHKNLGPIAINTIYLSLGVGSGNALTLGLSTAVSAELGPLQIAVDKIGFKTNIEFPDGGGSIGPMDLSFAFKPPEGIGLSIAKLGGGFLSFDPDNARYAGILHLQFGNIAIKAIGLLTTRLPGGAEGYSLLIILTAEFNPIQLSMGFTLNGVGGLLGLNRTMKIDPIRAGLKTSSLDNILFPSDPIANAVSIISDLREIFPPEEGRFIFGPMVYIGWGTPTLIHIKAGLLIEVPNPVRIAILGVVKTVLPDEEAKILTINVSFLGVLDFEKKKLSFDASLYDSKLLSFPLSGDMAVRLRWGSGDSYFLLSLGGFHPSFKPPIKLRKLERLTIQLTKGKNPRVKLECYFAITSNTVQFGSRAELYADAGSFNVNGFIGFDVLFRFSPFYFIAEFGASLALRKGKSEIAGIHLSGALEGPTPWKVRGKAKLKMLCFTVKVKFKKTFGKKSKKSIPDVDVLARLKEALENKGNWRSEIPPHLNNLVSVKDLSSVDPNKIIIQPFNLYISQTEVPLDITIKKFGNAKAADVMKYNITQVWSIDAGGTPRLLEMDDTFEKFAPAQFQKMSDREKLSRKSFENLKGGKTTLWSMLHANRILTREISYERIIIDRNGLRRIFDVIKITVFKFNALLAGNSIAKSAFSFMQKAASPLASEKVSISQEGFGIVNKSDLKLTSNDAIIGSQAEAMDYMADLISENPQLVDQIQVVPSFEVNQ